MKTQGSFDYKVNGENKTKEEVDSMDLSNMNCTVENLTVSYSFPAEKRLPETKTWLEEIEKVSLEKWREHHLVLPRKETIRTKTEEILDDVEQYQKVINGGVLKGGEFLSDNWFEKDDVITNSSRGEKEMMPELVGIKETEGKLDYSEINFRLLDLMANRFMDNKVKYPKGNSKKVLDKNEILWAAFRHIRKMIQPIENDPESYEEHLAAVATNLSIILDQLDLENVK